MTPTSCPACTAHGPHDTHCTSGRCRWLRCRACKATFDPTRTFWFFIAR